MSKCCKVGDASSTTPTMMLCPVNGRRSKRVDLLTVRSLVRRLPLGMSSTAYYFCEAPDCDVVYFPSTRSAPLFRRSDLLVPVWRKEQDDSVPVCYCFGFTRKQIVEEIRRTGRSTVAERITAEVKAGNCACELKNPSGKCCLGSIRQIERGL